MIRLSAIIKRLRVRCPSFQNRVGGTASFAEASAAGEEADLPVPHCFVVPMMEQSLSLPSEIDIGTRSDTRRETFATVVCVDNTVQGGGNTAGVMSLLAVDQIAAIEDELEDAFDAWVPDARYDAVQFHRGEHIAMDAKRLWHQFTWIVEWLDVPAEVGGIADQIRNLTEGPELVSALNTREIHETIQPPGSPSLGVPDDFLPPPPGPFHAYGETNQDTHQALYGGGVVELAQSFEAISAKFNLAKFYIKKVGLPTGTVVAKIYAHTGTFGVDSRPTGPLLAVSDNVNVATLPTTFALVNFPFTGLNDYNMIAGMKYCIAIEYSGGNAANYVDVGMDTVAGDTGNAAKLTGTTWATAPAADLIYYLYAWEPSDETLAAKNAGEDYMEIVWPTPPGDAFPVVAPTVPPPPEPFTHGPIAVETQENYEPIT